MVIEMNFNVFGVKIVFEHKRKLGSAKFAIRFVFGIMKMQKEPSRNSTLM